MAELTAWINSKEDIMVAIYGVVIILLIIVFINSWGKGRYMERENHYLEIQRILMQQHYEAMKEQISLTRKLRHDIANHLFTLETLEKDGKEKEASGYRQYLEKQYEKLKKVGYCTDPLIDAVIFQKKKLCEKEGIVFDVELLTLRMDWMEEFDRMRLFFDLTEYAVQRVRDLGEGKGGSIYLSCGSEKGYTLISCDVSPAVKRRAEERMALAAVRRIAEDYGGFLRVETLERGQRVTAALREKEKK